VKPSGWLAALVLFLHLPIPLYWFVVHPVRKFWRSHQKAAYVTGLLCSWPPVTAALVIYRHELFCADWPSAPMLVAGVGLIVFEGWIFWRVHRDLGTARLVGKTELSGGGELERRGIYARIRHPRYTGSFLAILGACLLAGTRAMWAVAGLWLSLMLLAISLEERELRARFGRAYEEYACRVPRFIPLRRNRRDR
jgi:protein-S-isoprenylcysteine O-methyltransferase Ste14